MEQCKHEMAVNTCGVCNGQVAHRHAGDRDHTGQLYSDHECYRRTIDTAVNAHAPWTRAEDDFLRELNGMDIAEIAIALGRTYGAVQIRRSLLGLTR